MKSSQTDPGSKVYRLTLGVLAILIPLLTLLILLNYLNGDLKTLLAKASKLVEEINLSSGLFAGILALYFLQLIGFRQALPCVRSNGPESLITSLYRYAQRASLLAACFFGVGVIFTAVGMRSALVGSLGQMDASQASEIGAYGILQRLIDGGILEALTTTIIGGAGGYLMRVSTLLMIGHPIQRLHASWRERERLAHRQLLERIIWELSDQNRKPKE